MIKLYHGSNIKIQVPDLIHSKPFKDFGKGFYLSDNEQQAWDLAKQKIEQLHMGQPEVSVFLFDETIMNGKELKVKVFDDYSEEWAQFVLDNRNEKFPQPQHDYDIVYGPIANDGVNFQLRRYRGGVISMQRLIEELKYAKGITFQYFFGTEHALQNLTAI